MPHIMPIVERNERTCINQNLCHCLLSLFADDRQIPSPRFCGCEAIDRLCVLPNLVPQPQHALKMLSPNCRLALVRLPPPKPERPLDAAPITRCNRLKALRQSACDPNFCQQHISLCF